MARVAITATIAPETHKYIETVVRRAGDKVGRGTVIDAAVAALIEKEKAKKEAGK